MSLLLISSFWWFILNVIADEHPSNSKYHRNLAAKRLSHPINNVWPADDPTHIVSSEWSTLVPYYPHYPTRTVQVLDGHWYFGYQNDWNVSKLEYSESERLELTPNVTIVPSAFDVAMPGILGPRGTGFYRANVTIASNHSIYVYFSACAFYCQLYIDGKYIGDHRAGGYQPFGFEVSAKEEASIFTLKNSDNDNVVVREVFVVVDNRFNNVTAPTYTGGDFYAYGGITRNVLIHTLPLAKEISETDFNYLKRIEVFPYDIKDGFINCNIVFGRVFETTDRQRFNFIFDNNTNNAQLMDAFVKFSCVLFTVCEFI